jgi:MoaA/NifB/PqqE/SkfB family radical SAM enzyme
MFAGAMANAALGKSAVSRAVHCAEGSTSMANSVAAEHESVRTSMQSSVGFARPHAASSRLTAAWVTRAGRAPGAVFFYRRADGALFKTRPEDMREDEPTFTSEKFVGWAPLKAYVDITNRCNLACRHCFTNSSPAVDTSVEMTTPRLVELVKELATLGVLEVGLAGGEPLLHPDWVEILGEVTAQGMNLIVTTNGLLLDDAAVVHLARIAPMDVRVSLDGGRELHDHVRGKGTYDRAMGGLAKLVRAGLPATARLTLCAGGEAEMPSLFEDLARIGVVRAKVALAKPTGRGATELGRHLVVDVHGEEVKQSVELLQRLAKEHAIKLTLAADDFEVEVHEGEMSKLRDVDRPNCGAGFETCHITPRGEILACSAIANLAFGTLREASFLDVWGGHVARKYRGDADVSHERRLCDALGDPNAAPPVPLRRKGAGGVLKPVG